MTRPDADNTDNSKIIEFACLYTMVMPTRIHLSHLNFTAGTNDGSELEQQFVGVPHISPAVDDLAIEQIKKIQYKFMNMGDFKYEG
jgi:enhancing lycopene biosynthesis protein 2